MINPQDLRIGNLVCGKNKKPLVITAIGTSATFDMLNGDAVCCDAPFDELFPIELTSDFLVKNGFKRGKTGDKKEDNFVEFWDIRISEHKHSFSNGFYFSIVIWWRNNKPQEFTFSHHEIRSDCKYIHQLQNLYFALSNKELQLK